MRKAILSSLALLALIGGVEATAQPVSQGYSGGTWDRDAFWRGAPDSIRDRINFLQRRIDRGISDGSLNRREGRRSQQELNDIRRQASRIGWNMRGRDRDTIQARLDNLAQRIRWRRQDGDYGYNGRDSDNRFATDYDASRYYRDDPRYSERRLGTNDEVYRGSDGRYYCKRNDGTTGLIVGAAAGGILGNVIDGGQHRVGGTLVGGALGALLGKSVDQSNDIRCR